MNEIINIVPQKYHALALFALAVLPYITRALHSLMNGGGLRSVMAAIWLGTNTPKPQAPVESPLQTKLPLALMLALLIPTFLMVTGCANFHSVQIKTEADGTKTESRQSITTLFDAKSEVSKLRASTTDKTQGLTVGSVAEDSSGSNAVSLVQSAVGAAVSAAVKAVAPVPK